MKRSFIMKKKIKKNGFITLEASIFLPVFIIGILTIGYLMKFIYVQENILYTICDEAKQVSENAYIIKAAPFFALTLEKKLEMENKNVDDVETEDFYYFLKTGEAYHGGECPTVEKYVIEIEKETAVKKGYYPCFKCGGE